MNYARNTWYVASWIPDLVPGEPFKISILDEPIVLWRSNGRLVAFEDRCVHRLAPLSLGRCEGANLRCMYHGMLFDAHGKTVEIPGQDLIPAQARVRAYPVVEKNSWVWVWMGDPAKADKSLIPTAVDLDDPNWIFAHGFLDYDAEAELINANLLDFSHLSYVHAKSFGAGAEFATVLPQMEKVPNGVRFLRWTPNTTNPVGGEVRKSTGGAVDVYMIYDYLIPGVLLLYNAIFPVGTAEASNFGPPDRSKAIAGVSTSCQAVTPLGKGKARYFFCLGPHRDHGDEQLRDLQWEQAWGAFLEDKTMIEGQQAAIDRTANPTIMPTVHDRAVTQFDQMVARLISEEHGQRPVPV